MILIEIIAAVVLLPVLCTAEMFESKEHSLTAPIVASEKDKREVNLWRLVSKATVGKDNVILLKQQGVGGIWNVKPLQSKRWEVQLHLQVPKNISTTGAMALWFVKEALISGPIYGYRDYFNGIGIVINGLDEKKRFDTSNQQRPGNLMVSLIMNNGSVSYYRLLREKRDIPIRTFCTFDQDPQAAFTNVSLRLLHSGDHITLWLGTNEAPEVKCFEMREIKPEIYFVGVTAMEQQNDEAMFVLNQVRVSASTEGTEHDGEPNFITAVAVVLTMFLLSWTAIQIGK